MKKKAWRKGHRSLKVNRHRRKTGRLRKAFDGWKVWLNMIKKRRRFIGLAGEMVVRRVSLQACWNDWVADINRAKACRKVSIFMSRTLSERVFSRMKAYGRWVEVLRSVEAQVRKDINFSSVAMFWDLWRRSMDFRLIEKKGAENRKRDELMETMSRWRILVQLNRREKSSLAWRAQRLTQEALGLWKGWILLEQRKRKLEGAAGKWKKTKAWQQWQKAFRVLLKGKEVERAAVVWGKKWVWAGWKKVMQGGMLDSWHWRQVLKHVFRTWREFLVEEREEQRAIELYEGVLLSKVFDAWREGACMRVRKREGINKLRRGYVEADRRWGLEARRILRQVWVAWKNYIHEKRRKMALKDRADDICRSAILRQNFELWLGMVRFTRGLQKWEEKTKENALIRWRMWGERRRKMRRDQNLSRALRKWRKFVGSVRLGKDRGARSEELKRKRNLLQAWRIWTDFKSTRKEERKKAVELMSGILNMGVQKAGFWQWRRGAKMVACAMIETKRLMYMKTEAWLVWSRAALVSRRLCVLARLHELVQLRQTFGVWRDTMLLGRMKDATMKIAWRRWRRFVGYRKDHANVEQGQALRLWSFSRWKNWWRGMAVRRRRSKEALRVWNLAQSEAQVRRALHRLHTLVQVRRFRDQRGRRGCRWVLRRWKRRAEAMKEWGRKTEQAIMADARNRRRKVLLAWWRVTFLKGSDRAVSGATT